MRSPTPAEKTPMNSDADFLTKHPRHLGVLELAAQKAGWGKPPAPGQARGIAVHESFGSFIAQVAEVSVSPAGEVRVHKVVCAVDCGRFVNPGIIEAQMEGGIVYGLSAALHGAITFKDGRVEQGNFNDYPILTMKEMPVIEVHIVPSQESPGGIGEPGVPPIAPAVTNAIYAATAEKDQTIAHQPGRIKKIDDNRSSKAIRLGIMSGIFQLPILCNTREREVAIFERIRYISIP